MKARIVLAALWICAFTGSTARASTRPLEQMAAVDSCALARPEFGVASPAERNLFAYDANAPLNLKTTLESTDNNGVEVSAISFDSPDGGSVTGMLFDPVKRAGPRPGIVLHMGMANARGMAGQGQALAAHGAVVIAIDAPFHRRGGQLLQFSPQDRAEQIQLIKDLQRAVDVLRARPNVDDGRIAYLGYSYGGAMGALFVVIERRLKAAVLEVADGGLVTHQTDPDDDTLAGLSCAVRVAWLRAMTPIEPIRFISHAPPTALLLQNGRSDTAVPAADAEALHKAAPEGTTIRWYDAGHGLNQQALIYKHEWLNAQIGLDRLSDALAAVAPPAPTAQAPGIELPAAVLDRYVGEYKTASGFTATFRRDGDRLVVKPGPNPEAPLNARSETRFQDPRGPIFEFQRDAQGKVTGAILEQQGPQGTQRIPLERK